MRVSKKPSGENARDHRRFDATEGKKKKTPGQGPSKRNRNLHCGETSEPGKNRGEYGALGKRHTRLFPSGHKCKRTWTPVPTKKQGGIFTKRKGTPRCNFVKGQKKNAIFSPEGKNLNKTLSPEGQKNQNRKKEGKRNMRGKKTKILTEKTGRKKGGSLPNKIPTFLSGEKKRHTEKINATLGEKNKNKRKLRNKKMLKMTKRKSAQAAGKQPQNHSQVAPYERLFSRELTGVRV